MHLEPDMWPVDQQIEHNDNEFFTRIFTLEEVDKTMKEMKKIQLLVLMVLLWSSLKPFGLK
jgi:hypothetical protein